MNLSVRVPFTNRVFTFAARDKSKPARPIGGSIGSGGSPIFTNMLGEDEWNADLKGLSGLQTLEKMAVSDPTVHAAQMAMTLPLLGAEWKVTPFSDSTRDKDIAEFVDDQLFNMATAWSDWLAEALDVLIFGHYGFEPIWDISSDAVNLIDLSPRPPTSITEILVDEHGSMTGVQQQKTGEAGSYALVTIPAEKLLWFCRGRRGNQWRGRSIYRAAHKPWFIKKELEAIAAIGFEKRANGVDVGTLEEDEAAGEVTEKRRSDVERALMGMQSREKGFMTEVPGFKYRIEGVSGTLLDPVPFIDKLDTSILRSVMAEFLAMGADGAGSLAMHRDKSSFFTLGLKGIARIITDPINWKLIPQIVAFNFDGVPDEETPTLTHSRLDTRDIAAVADSVNKLVSVGALAPDRDVENAMRESLELPLREEGEAAQAGHNLMYVGGELRHVPPRQIVHSCAAKPRRKLHHAETFTDFRAINDALDSGLDKITDAVGKTMAETIKAMVAHAEKAWEADDPKALMKPPFEAGDQIVEDISKELIALWKIGRADVDKEVKAQAIDAGVAVEFAIPPPDPAKIAEVARLFNLSAEAIASLMESKLLSSYIFTMKSMLRTGNFDADVLASNLTTLSEKEAAKAARASITEAMSLGRSATFAKLEATGNVDHYIYSAIGDDNTCPPCELSDGTSVEPGSAEFDALEPPLQNGPDGPCEGDLLCRCQYIAVLKTERGPG